MNTYFTSGIGQFHTNEPDKLKPDKQLTPYLKIDLDGIRALVDLPQQVDKSKAQWFIPSTLLSRCFKTQEVNGEFWMLWADFDKCPPPLFEIKEKIEPFLDCDFELYNSRGATVNNQKSRLLIPIAKPLSGADWMVLQEILNDRLESLGIIPDRAAERPAQLCYLPNKGVFYGSRSQRDGLFFDPMESWQDEITCKREKIESDRLALESAKQAAKIKREALNVSGSYDLIPAFNQAYTPQDWLLKAGYSQKGNTFRHPGSESGSYSASVRPDQDGLLRVNTLSSSDPLYSTGSGAHDAFGTFAVLMHGGDNNAALKDAGDNLLTIGSVSFNRAMQLEFAKKKAAQREQSIAPKPAHTVRPEHTIDFDSMPDYGEEQKTKAPFSMSAFSLSGQSKIMESKMLADRYLLDRIAILGQATAIYAKPNTGKTLLVLWMLIDSIKSERINGKDVFYINADDDYKGLVYKTGLAERYGFEMLSPGHNGFESACLQGYMRQMIDDDTARGKVIILDTLKKFTDLMNKKTGSEFMTRAREFVAHGGSLVMLAHCNKNRDADGKAVFGGTSDIVDDCDCVFMLDEIAKTSTTKQVLFENIKSRGVVANELAFSYSVEEGKHYQYRLDSVELTDQAATEDAKQRKIIADRKEKDRLAISAITESIEQGFVLKTSLIDEAYRSSGQSKAKLYATLDAYLGTSIDKGFLWRESIGAKNAKSYHLLTKFQASPADYSFFKDGE